MANDRLFIGIYPMGIVYADREVEVLGDYKRLAFLSYRTLDLELKPDCPAELRGHIENHAEAIQARRGQQYEVSTSGQTVLLGGGK